MTFRFSPISYKVRLWKALAFGILFYGCFSAFILTFSDPLLFWALVSIVFLFKFYAAASSIRFQIVELSVDNSTFDLQYLDKNTERQQIIPLSQLKLKKGVTLTKTPEVYIKIYNNDEYIGSFYSGNHHEATNESFNSLFVWLIDRKRSC